jgi:hypothetical protein
MVNRTGSFSIGFSVGPAAQKSRLGRLPESAGRLTETQTNAMLWNQESLVNARGVVMIVVAAVILVAYIISHW